jgi:protein tyrosine phosphatase (PTP) superfamily phosphohydrolase (DUF442 family)
MSFKIILKTFKYLIGLILFIAVAGSFYIFIYGNFHKVDKDVYRSAQLFDFNTPHYLEKYKIKSILNLRGETDNQSYKDEIAFAKQYSIKHYNFAIGTSTIQTVKDMEKIVEIIKNAPKPILLHCKSGADRTALASALYLHTIKHDKNAQDAITLLYGHFPWLTSKSDAIDKSFEIYKSTYPLKK